MWTSGPRLKLRMELTPNVPRMGLQLDDLHERAVRRQTAQVQSVLDERITVLVVDFVAVAMALTPLLSAVNLGGLRSNAQPARIRAQPHGAAHVSDVLLVFHE